MNEPPIQPVATSPTFASLTREECNTSARDRLERLVNDLDQLSNAKEISTPMRILIRALKDDARGVCLLMDGFVPKF